MDSRRSEDVVRTESGELAQIRGGLAAHDGDDDPQRTLPANQGTSQENLGAFANPEPCRDVFELDMALGSQKLPDSLDSFLDWQEAFVVDRRRRRAQPVLRGFEPARR